MNLREQWLRAEAATLSGQPESPAILASLPPSLAWLAKALVAIDAGHIDAITALRQEAHDAQQYDVCALLSALCGQLPDPSSSTPPNGLLSELLNILVARIQKLPEPIPSQTLQEASELRPALRATLKVLSAVEGLPGKLTKDAVLENMLPRAEQVRVASTILIQHGTINPETLVKAFGRALIDLTPSRWPDLYPGPEALLLWAADVRPWTSQQQLALKSLVRADEPTRRSVLGALLARINRDLSAGRVAGLQDPTWAAEGLSSTLPDCEALGEQLYTLRLRLQWVEDDAPPELLAALWVQHNALTKDERLTLARALMETPPENVPQSVIVGCQLFLLAQTPDDDEAAAMLEMGASQAQRSVLSQGLDRMGASPARRTHLLGLHAALNADIPFALASVTALAQEDLGEPAGMVLLRTLSRIPHQKPPHPMLAPEIAPLLLETLEALSERPHLRFSLDHWPFVLVHLRALLGSVPESFHALILNNLGPVPSSSSPDPRLCAARLLALWVLSPGEASREWMRELGRTLRDLQPESLANDLAFQTIAWFLFWADPTDRDALQALLLPLTRFVLRAGPATAAATASRAALLGEPQTRGGVQWFFWNRDALGDDPRWIDLCCKVVAVPDAFAEAGAQMVRAALTEHPTSLFEFRAKIHTEIGKLIQASMHRH